MSPMSNKLLVPRQTPGLLDLVPGAAAAYSLRSLSRSYAGPVVTVRRGSDDTEDSFTASEVSDGTLAAFAGAGDAFVKTWHSQTGSNDASQTTAAYQPKIVNSGVVILEEGKPAIQFDGGNDYLSSLDLASVFSGIDKTTSTFCVGRDDLANVGTFWNAGSSSSNAPLYLVNTSAGTVNMFARNDLIQGTQNISVGFSGQTLSSAFFLPSDQSLYVNGAIAGVDSHSLGQVTLTEFAIGILVRTTAYSFPLDGTMQELIIYPSDLTEQRELVEGLIAWGYSV